MQMALTIVVFVLATSIVSGMEFGKETLWYKMDGPIITGDAEKFRLFLLKNKSDWQFSRPLFSLNSEGGNVWEAMQMAKLLRAIHANTMILGDREIKCVSACFFLYLAGIERSVAPKGALGIHRAYIDPIIFAKLRPADAQAIQRELTNAIAAFLKDNQVPQHLIELMNRASSREIVWLTAKDLDDIGNYPPWYEELLIAKCSLDKKRERAHYASKSRSAAEEKSFDEYHSRVFQCKDRIFTEDLPTINYSLSKPIALTPLSASRR